MIYGEKMNEKTLAENLTQHRKNSGLTQLQLAEKLNYSDKAVSKWERGDSAPDIFVLQKLADIYKISIGELLGEKEFSSEKPKKIKTKKPNRPFFMFAISVGIIWLVATAAFALCLMFATPIFDFWLFFIYAVPLTFIDIFVYVRVRRKKVDFFSLSLILWTIALSLFLSMLNFDRIWLVFVVAAPAEVIVFFFCKFRNARLERVKAI